MAVRGQQPATPEHPGPRLLTGALAGFCAGVAFIALTSWFATSLGQPPLEPFRMIASMAEPAAPEQIPDVWLGMAIHSALSVLLGMIFAALTALVRGNGMLMTAGFLFGGIVYAINFHILARFLDVFANFRGANQPFELAIHLVFGGILALFLLRRPRRVGPGEQARREEVPRVPTGTA